MRFSWSAGKAAAAAFSPSDRCGCVRILRQLAGWGVERRRTCSRPIRARARHASTMHIGVPKEIKVLEHRVGLTPESVREARTHGHDVIVETRAGQGIGMDD